MAENANLPYTAILDAFLDENQARGSTVLSAADRDTVRCALEDFLLDEWWLQDGNSAIALLADITSLEKAALTADGVAPAIRRLKDGIEALAARVARSEHALMIQREHAMMLSEQLKTPSR